MAVKSRYFSESEFNRCTPSCSLKDMSQCAMNDFDMVRDFAGIPLVINSAYRSSEWDRARGRSGTGPHTQGVALDIRCNNSTNRWKIINALIKAGCQRIGVYKTFIHGDFSKNLPPKVIW